MKKIAAALTLLTLLIFVRPLMAMEVIDLTGGGPYVAKISDHAINRVVLPWAPTEIIVQKQAPIDTKLVGASLYLSVLRPINGNVDLFVLFDGHDPISLSLTPAAISAETIVVKSAYTSQKKASNWEKTSAYERSIKELIKKMVQSDLPPGYSVEEVASRDLSPWKEASIQHKRTYGGSTLSGEVYELVNQSQGDLTVNEEEIAKILGEKEVRAIAISSRSLKAGEATNIYIVRSRIQN